MPIWDPAQYLRYGAERLRPALDLIARIPLTAPRRIYDLGCGAGNVTRMLAERWPDAEIEGVDSSAAMLDKARDSGVSATWSQHDLREWQPAAGADVIFSNAVLHWLDDHPSLLGDWLRALAAGGALAVQMPNNFKEPTHTAIAAALREIGAYDQAQQVLRPGPVLAPAEYHHLLSTKAATVDVWETTYHHLLEGDDPVVEWTRGSVLRPVLEALAEPERTRFLVAYAERVRIAYPPRKDGRTLLPFRRVFCVGTAS